jgi:hypothetical protein
MPFERDRVAAALLHSWSLETSGQWLVSNPARGQCNVTALPINEFFCGEILKTPLAEGGQPNQWRRIDLTDSQFEAPLN